MNKPILDGGVVDDIHIVGEDGSMFIPVKDLTGVCDSNGHDKLKDGLSYDWNRKGSSWWKKRMGPILIDLHDMDEQKGGYIFILY